MLFAVSIGGILSIREYVKHPFFSFSLYEQKVEKAMSKGLMCIFPGGDLNRLLYSRGWIDACGHDYAESGPGWCNY